MCNLPMSYKHMTHEMFNIQKQMILQAKANDFHT